MLANVVLFITLSNCGRIIILIRLKMINIGNFGGGGLNTPLAPLNPPLKSLS